MAIATLLGELANEKDMRFIVSNYDVVEGVNIFNLMPLQEQMTNTWKFATNSNNRKESARIIATNSTLPEGNKGVTEYMRGELPKIGIKYSMDEDELAEYKMAMDRATSDQAAQELIAETMGNYVQKCVKAIQNRVTWMGLQGMSRGIIRLTGSNNGSIVADEDVDYMMDKRGRYGAAWTDKEKATPISGDFVKAVREGEHIGRRYRYAWMSLNTFAAFASIEEVIKLSASFATNFLGAAYIPSVDAVNTALRGRADLKGLQIKIIDEVIDIEGEVNNPFIDGVVLFTETEQTGRTYWTTPPDMLAESAGAYRAQNSYVCIKKWADEDPLMDYTAGVSRIFPAFTASQRAMLVDVLNEHWNEGGKLDE